MEEYQLPQKTIGARKKDSYTQVIYFSTQFHFVALILRFQHSNRFIFPFGTETKDKLLRPQQTRTHCCRHKCFPVCPRAQHLLQTQILCPGHKKCFCFYSEIFCARNKCFPVLRNPRNIMGNKCVLVYQGLVIGYHQLIE